MTLFSKTPSFNLKVVIQETGIKPDTLRAWERRYDLPQPGRTTGGHRLYSQYDIEIVKWLIARQDEGMSISRAVKFWRQMIKDGQDPLQSMTPVANETSAMMSRPIGGPALQEFAHAWIDACLDFDEEKAESILTRAFALYPPEVVCVDVIQKSIAKLGEMWYEDKASVQQEHFASALAMRRLNSLLGAAPKPTRNGRILIACPPEEHHTFAPLLLTLMLRYKGWEVIYLGANVPQNRFEATIERTHPQLVVLTAQQLHTAAKMYDLVMNLESAEPNIAFGGLIFIMTPSLRQRIPGHFIGESLEEAVQIIERLIVQKPALAQSTPTPAGYREALHTYRMQQALIERDVWQTLQNQNISYDYVLNANYHLARDITAALTLGDIDYLGPEIDWVKKLLVNYKFEPSNLMQYLEAYAVAANKFMRPSTNPVVAWLDRVTDDSVLGILVTSNGNGRNGSSRN